MSNKDSRTVLDWFRSYAHDKLGAIGQTVDQSNMVLPFNNDPRMQAALDYLLVRETQLWAAHTPDLDAHWAAAIDEVWTEITTQMPPDIVALFDPMFTDPDLLVKRLVKAFSRVLGLLVMRFRAGV